MRPLDEESLSALPADVGVPGYDRSAVTASIVHFGVGGFHRAHQAMYLDRLMRAGAGQEWGVCGVGVMPGDRAIRDALAAQDHLYTLAVKHPDGTMDLRVIGSLVEYLFAPDDYDAVIERLASPATRIVSLTVTEGGYHLDPVTGEFDGRSRQVEEDTTPGRMPTSTFGIIAEALARRRDRAQPAFTVMSCDNIQGNGDVARRTLVEFARRKDEALGDWVEGNVSFPNSMVDRITPVTTEEDRRAVSELLGVRDLWPVVCEPFTQWVLEDDFRLGRPPLEDAGVQVVDDVMPYELMKLRLLNASHQALCYLGYLSGYRYVHDVCQDPLFVEFLLGYMDEEATPTLLPVPGVDLHGYKRELVERFANPGVRDTVARLCAESSDRIPKWLLPVVRHQLRSGGELRRSALVVASWARYAEGVDEDGAPIDVVDRLSDVLVPAARRQRQDLLAFIENRDVFGDLVDQERFVDEYRSSLESLHRNGARATLEALAASLRTD